MSMAFDEPEEEGRSPSSPERTPGSWIERGGDPMHFLPASPSELPEWKLRLIERRRGNEQNDGIVSPISSPIQFHQITGSPVIKTGHHRTPRTPDHQIITASSVNKIPTVGCWSPAICQQANTHPCQGCEGDFEEDAGFERVTAAPSSAFPTPPGRHGDKAHMTIRSNDFESAEAPPGCKIPMTLLDRGGNRRSKFPLPTMSETTDGIPSDRLSQDKSSFLFKGHKIESAAQTEDERAGRGACWSRDACDANGIFADCTDPPVATKYSTISMDDTSEERANSSYHHHHYHHHHHHHHTPTASPRHHHTPTSSGSTTPSKSTKEFYIGDAQRSPRKDLWYRPMYRDL